jgi:hypothetical protein
MKRPYDSGRYDWTCPKCGMHYRILQGTDLDTPSKHWHRCPWVKFESEKEKS